MRLGKTIGTVAATLSWLALTILAVLPFHAFLTVWASSFVGHYTLLRLWKELLVVIMLPGFFYLLAATPGLARRLFSSWAVRLITIYFALLLLAGFIALARGTLTPKALAYGELIDLRFFGFFILVMTIAACSPILKQKWQPAMFIPATLVIVFGLMQYLVLPYDYLKHFGYGAATISPYETINHNINRLRIASSLRGANPLGAYLVIIVSLFVAVIATAKKKRTKELFGLIGALLALTFTYSRSAWIGTVISAAIILWLAIKTVRFKRVSLILAGALILIAIAGGILLRHNTIFEDAIFHTDHQSSIAVSSNEGHTAAFKNGIHDIANNPLGRGTGTAGPASVYNNQHVRIAENYFLQIGQEVGIIGMGLFIAINIMVGRQLWRSRTDPLVLALLASLVGLTFVNMLSHAWTDDTLAYIWWGLAGIALSPVILERKSNKHDQKRVQAKT